MHMLTNEYRLLRRLGRGGMGEVWEAARIKENHVVVPCAIKLLHLDFTESSRERKLFFDEARIATQLDHSRIVKVIDIGADKSGRPFLVMERVDGIDLRSFLKEADKESLIPLDIEITTFIVGEVLAALDYAHERTIGGADAGIIHSDVTPGNIMISSSGEVKLTDFGIARFAATAGPMSRAIGTPRYMSPEQLSGDPKRETDIYGLGVVLHEMLDGKRFLDGCTPDQFRARVLGGPPPQLDRSGVPDWLDDLRRRMIATDHRDRPRASEARAVLIEYCPRYLAAGERLKTNYYARLIGRRRSGVTQLLDVADDGHMHGLIAQIGQQAADDPDRGGAGRSPNPAQQPQRATPGQRGQPDPHGLVTEPNRASSPRAPRSNPQPSAQIPTNISSPATYTADRAGRLYLSESGASHDLIEATEVLPAHGTAAARAEQTGKQEVSETNEDSISTPLSSRPGHAGAGAIREHAPYLRWLALGSGTIALAFLVTALVLLVQMLRAEDPGQSNPDPRVVEVVEPDTDRVAEALVTPSIAEPKVVEPEVVEPKVVEPKVVAPEVVAPEVVEPEVVEPTDVEPTGVDPVKQTKTKPDPKPKAVQKIGVVFIIASDRGGMIKAGRHTAKIKHRSSYLELPLGTHKISWQPADSKDWAPQGKITVKDISPKLYEVKIDGGTITGVKQL
jgi:serine/threonine protein kinase